VPGSRITGVDGDEVSTWDDYLTGLLEGEGELRISWVDPAGVEHRTSFMADDSLRQVIAGSIEPFIEPVVGEVMKDNPADLAGLKEGDRFLRIRKNDTEYNVARWDDVVEVIHASPDTEIVLTMQRGDSIFEVPVVPERGNIPNTETTVKEVGLIGIAQYSVTRTLPLTQALVESVDRAFFLARYILDFLGKLVTLQVSPRYIGGPILVGQMAGESAKQGFDKLLSFMALFSVNLAVLNMLPVPVLDGGHVAFLLVEFVRRRPLSVEQRARLSQVGFILLILLMVFVTFNDGLRILGF
jgi:regulator of sigma E protease